MNLVFLLFFLMPSPSISKEKSAVHLQVKEFVPTMQKEYIEGTRIEILNSGISNIKIQPTSDFIYYDLLHGVIKNQTLKNEVVVALKSEANLLLFQFTNKKKKWKKECSPHSELFVDNLRIKICQEDIEFRSKMSGFIDKLKVLSKYNSMFNQGE